MASFEIESQIEREIERETHFLRRFSESKSVGNPRRKHVDGEKERTFRGLCARVRGIGLAKAENLIKSLEG